MTKRDKLDKIFKESSNPMKVPIRGENLKDVQCLILELFNSLVFILKVSPIANKLSENF